MMRFLVFMVLLSIINQAIAECRINKNFSSATHYLVNGLINKPTPEVIFNVPYDQVGNGQALAVSDVLNNGGNKTLSEHIRFRLRVKNKSSSSVDFIANTMSPLSCINCSEQVTVPFSSFFWVEGNSTETKGISPSVSRFNDAEQHWFEAAKSSDNIFNLKFFFDNNEILPPGTYEGELKTIGRPQ